MFPRRSTNKDVPLKPLAFAILTVLLVDLARGQAPVRPAEGDDSIAALRRYQTQIEARFGGYREIPLAVKAAYFEWELGRYHRTEHGQVYNRVELSDQPGVRPITIPGSDTSTWNGSLLAAMSYKYAVTRDPVTLQCIADLVRGLHFFFEVTGQPGLMARSISPADGRVLDNMREHQYVAPDGRVYYYRNDPAKGTYNQIAGGYAAMCMFALDDLPADVRAMALADMHAMVLHVIETGYHPTEKNGVKTRYGNMMPVAGPIGVPFNAQVAYGIIALGYSFPPEDAAQRETIRREFVRLRGEKHAYYIDPWLSLVRPQEVAASPFVKGMNDRNHAINAAFVGLMLERNHAHRQGEAWNGKFMFELGQTMYWGMQALDGQHHSLGTFMWAGMLEDQGVFDAMIKSRRNSVRAQIERNLPDAVEQLRRFRLDRFVYPGAEQEQLAPVWNDFMKPDDSYWKVNPKLVWHANGPATNTCYCAMDYLYAYWLMRYFKLDEAPVVQVQHAGVLRKD
jgi:hypothetical protein